MPHAKSRQKHGLKQSRVRPPLYQRRSLPAGAGQPGVPGAAFAPQCRGLGLRVGMRVVGTGPRVPAATPAFSPYTWGRIDAATPTPTHAKQGGASPSTGRQRPSRPLRPLKPSASATHRSGGLSGGWHDGRKRGRHAIAAHTLTQQTAQVGSERGNQRARPRPKGESADRWPALPGARPGACAPTPRRPPRAPRARDRGACSLALPARLSLLCVTMSGFSVRPIGCDGTAAEANPLPEAAHARCG